MRPCQPGLLHDGRAAISVELALLASLVLLPLTLGAVDAAELLTARARLDQAMHAALFYAWANSGNVAASDVQTNAAAGYGSGPAPSIAASITQYCIAPATGYPATGTPPLPGNGGCGSGQSVQSYLAVTASAAVTLPFSLAFMPGAVTLSVSGQARIH